MGDHDPVLCPTHVDAKTPRYRGSFRTLSSSSMNGLISFEGEQGLLFAAAHIRVTSARRRLPSPLRRAQSPARFIGGRVRSLSRRCQSSPQAAPQGDAIEPQTSTASNSSRRCRRAEGRGLQLSSFDGRRDLQAVAVFCDGAPCDDNMRLAQALDDHIVRQNVAGVFFIDHLADALADGLGRMRLARVGRDGRRKEILHLEKAARRLNELVRRRARDRRTRAPRSPRRPSSD